MNEMKRKNVIGILIVVFILLLVLYMFYFKKLIICNRILKIEEKYFNIYNNYEMSDIVENKQNGKYSRYKNYVKKDSDIYTFVISMENPETMELTKVVQVKEYDIANQTGKGIIYTDKGAEEYSIDDSLINECDGVAKINIAPLLYLKENNKLNDIKKELCNIKLEVKENLYIVYYHEAKYIINKDTGLVMERIVDNDEMYWHDVYEFKNF